MWRENFGKVGVVVVFGGGWPVPAVKNSPFRRYLSNGPKIVSNGALQPQFRTPQNFTFVCHLERREYIFVYFGIILLVYGCGKLIGQFSVSVEGKFRKKNQAERTPNSKSPGRETPSCKISAQTELKSGSFGQLENSLFFRHFLLSLND